MRNVAWSFGNTFLSKGFSFIFSVIIGNLMLPGELGLFVTLMLIITYGANIFSINLGGGIVQKLNSITDSAEQSRFFTAGVMGTLFLSILAMVVLFLIRGWVIRLFQVPNAREVIHLTYPLLALAMLKSYFTHVHQAHLNFRQLTLISVVADVSQVIVTLLLLLLGYGLQGVFWGLYAGAAIALVPLVHQSVKRYGLILNASTWNHLWGLLGFSSVIFIGSVAVLLDQRIDMLFVAHFLENQDVALYDYVLKFSLLFVLFGNSISRVTYPKFTRAFSTHPREDINQTLSFSLNYTFFFLTLASLLFFLHAELIIDLILPSFYVQLVPYLLILLVGVIPKSVVTSVGTLFTAKGIPSVSAWINWLLLAVNVALNIILIPRYGLYGAAFATSTSFLLKPVIVFALIARKIKVQYPFGRLLLNFVLFIGVLVGGHFIDHYLLRELLFLAYLFYCYRLFLGREEKQYLQLGWSRFHHKMLQFIRM